MKRQTLLLDLEGTFYTRTGMIDGALEALAELRNSGHTVRFLTNTDSKASSTLVAELSARGLDLDETELFTPVVAASLLVSSSSDARILVLASEEVREQLGNTLNVTTLVGDLPVTHVIVGDVRSLLSYEALDAAFSALRKGAKLIALQKGRYFLSGDSAHIDTGAIVAALEYASGVQATVVGKPSNSFLSLAIESIPGGAEPETTWVVGDDRSTDISMGIGAGVHTVQVRTGKFGDQADVGSLPKPEHTINSIAAFPTTLRNYAL